MEQLQPRPVLGVLGRFDAQLSGTSRQPSPCWRRWPPYGPGIASWTDAGVSLGRRYAVDAGADPRAAPAALEPDASGLVVVAAARLDDRDDREALCDALGLSPAARAAHDDHALILKAYRRWGGDCPNHLLGDYAFALWDGNWP